MDPRPVGSAVVRRSVEDDHGALIPTLVARPDVTYLNRRVLDHTYSTLNIIKSNTHELITRFLVLCTISQRIDNFH